MLSRWAGPLVTALIIGGVAVILLLNLNLTPTAPTGPPTSVTPHRPVTVTPDPASSVTRPKPRGFREYPIGDEVVRESHADRGGLAATGGHGNGRDAGHAGRHGVGSDSP